MAVPDRLGDGDPLEALRRTGGTLGQVVGAHDVEVLRRRPFADKWTPCEIIGHLVDHEIATTCRIRTLRFDVIAWLSSYDQEAWTTTQRHNEQNPAEFIRRFDFLRGLNLEQYDSLTAEEWSREKPQSRGDDLISFDSLVRRHANHDLHHLDQLMRYVAAANT